MIIPQKIYKFTKWKPVYSFKESVESTTFWYKNFYNNETNNFDYSINQIKNYVQTARKRKIKWIK